MTGGIESALSQGRSIAGDKDVMVGGGGVTLEQFMRAGLLDEVRIHVVPVVLGAGRPLFASSGQGLIELEPIEVIPSPNATHVRYRLSRT